MTSTETENLVCVRGFTLKRGEAVRLYTRLPDTAGDVPQGQQFFQLAAMRVLLCEDLFLAVGPVREGENLLEVAVPASYFECGKPPYLDFGRYVNGGQARPRRMNIDGRDEPSNLAISTDHFRVTLDGSGREGFKIQDREQDRFPKNGLYLAGWGCRSPQPCEVIPCDSFQEANAICVINSTDPSDYPFAAPRLFNEIVASATCVC